MATWKKDLLVNGSAEATEVKQKVIIEKHKINLEKEKKSKELQRAGFLKSVR